MTLTFSFLTLKPSKRYELNPDLHPFPEFLGDVWDWLDRVVSAFPAAVSPTHLHFAENRNQAGTVIGALGHVPGGRIDSE